MISIGITISLPTSSGDSPLRVNRRKERHDLEAANVTRFDGDVNARRPGPTDGVALRRIRVADIAEVDVTGLAGEQRVEDGDRLAVGAVEVIGYARHRAGVLRFHCFRSLDRRV